MGGICCRMESMYYCISISGLNARHPNQPLINFHRCIQAWTTTINRMRYPMVYRTICIVGTSWPTYVDGIFDSINFPWIECSLSHHFISRPTESRIKVRIHGVDGIILKQSRNWSEGVWTASLQLISRQRLNGPLAVSGDSGCQDGFDRQAPCHNIDWLKIFIVRDQCFADILSISRISDIVFDTRLRKRNRCNRES